MVICNNHAKTITILRDLNTVKYQGGMISSTNIDKIQQLLATYLFGRLYDESTCRLLWSHFTCSAYSLTQINSSKNFHKNVTWENMFFVTSKFFFCWIFLEMKIFFVGFSKKIKNLFVGFFRKWGWKIACLERTNAASQDNLYCSKIVILTWEV